MEDLGRVGAFCRTQAIFYVQISQFFRLMFGGFGGGMVRYRRIDFNFLFFLKEKTTDENI